MIFWQIIVGAATHCAYPGLSASRISPQLDRN